MKAQNLKNLPDQGLHTMLGSLVHPNAGQTPPHFSQGHRPEVELDILT